MISLGIDIGTTTISTVVSDSIKGVIDSLTVSNGAFYPDRPTWEKIQYPDVIIERAMGSVNKMLEKYPNIECIGLTGQMHGIVYLDNDGKPCSPLYTWQDGRGEQPYGNGQSYVEHLSGITGYQLATGFGLVTNYYNMKNGLIPKEACSFCAIQDLLAMKLAGLSRPVTDASDAASFGLFDLASGDFDREAIAKAGMDISLLPEVAKEPIIGTGELGIPVTAAIGDNQASFLGGTSGNTDCMIVNVGTGGQFSAYSPSLVSCPGLETRPFPDGGYLIVGSSLCSGRAFAILVNFFRQTVKMATGEDISCYKAVDKMLEESTPVTDFPDVCTLFEGTRANPDLRGSITNLNDSNFTPLHLTYGLMHGMANEFYDMYKSYRSGCSFVPSVFIGTGNGLRKNKFLCNIISEKFGFELHLSTNDEEAAYGASLFAIESMK